MGNYMDNTYLAIDGVIVSYSGSDDVLTVPSRLIQMDIVRIGDGSFMDSRMSKVIISDGIKEIGKNAFSKCCNLKEVVIPASVTTVCSNAFTNDLPKLDSIFIDRYPLQAQQYLTLKRSAIRINSNKYLTTNYAGLSLINNVMNSTSARPAQFIPGNISRLFSTRDMTAVDPEAECFNISFGLSGGDGKTVEFSSVLADKADHSDPDTEAKHDELLKKDAIPGNMMTAILIFDESNLLVDAGHYYVNAEIRIGYHFWQSFLPIIHAGKQYYLYRRNYLRGDDKYKYSRVDVAILDDSGSVVKNKDEALDVYGKYKILSIL
ncbi:MAG: leucine-rich repeat protein [Clostridia bacterium]|nr:leucine-rich repeat protein [Clostridia bacterium]